MKAPSKLMHLSTFAPCKGHMIYIQQMLSFSILTSYEQLNDRDRYQSCQHEYL